MPTVAYGGSASSSQTLWTSTNLKGSSGGPEGFLEVQKRLTLDGNIMQTLKG